jgi:hypothetical protein
MEIKMNNPGIDLEIWKQLRKKWADLDVRGHKIKVDFQLIAHPMEKNNILAIDVIQHIDGKPVTETVQRVAGAAYSALGIVGLPRERLVDVYKGMMKQLHSQTKVREIDLIVTMSLTSPTSGELTGLLVMPDAPPYNTQGNAMSTLFSRHSTMISLLLILALFATIWLFPSIGIMLGMMILLFFGLVATSCMIVKKHRETYLQGKIPRVIFIRNVCLEISGILLAMILAGLLGRYLAGIATRQIDHELIKLVAGIGLGLLVGMVVGVLIKRVSSHLVRTSSGG